MISGALYAWLITDMDSSYLMRQGRGSSLPLSCAKPCAAAPGGAAAGKGSAVPANLFELAVELRGLPGNMAPSS